MYSHCRWKLVSMSSSYTPHNLNQSQGPSHRLNHINLHKQTVKSYTLSVSFKRLNIITSVLTKCASLFLSVSPISLTLLHYVTSCMTIHSPVRLMFPVTEKKQNWESLKLLWVECLHVKNTKTDWDSMRNKRLMRRRYKDMRIFGDTILLSIQ